MRSPGWMTAVLAAALATPGAADNATAKPDKAVKAEKAADKKTQTVDKKADAKGKPSGDKAAKNVEAAKPAKPDEMALATDDPVLGKADRIDGDELKGMVAFTFDDGPNEATTPAVIDALEKYNIPATFFIVSQRIVGKLGEQRRTVLHREISGGFLVESHSYSHPNLKGADTKTLSLEIDSAVKMLAKEAGHTIGMFRPPYGAIDGTGRGWLKKRGLTEVRWSVDTLDWKASDVEKLRKKVIKMIIDQDGGVVLMHDVKPITSKTVALVLDDLEAENCQRLADKKEPIWPVSIHYFVHDKKAQRAIPADVQARTDAYKKALPDRCKARPPAPPKAPEPPPKPSKTATKK